jgi:hypothetical protein
MSKRVSGYDLNSRVLKTLFVFQILVSLCFLFDGRLLGQVDYSESVASGRVTPSPDSLLGCLAFARYDSVKKYLNLDKEQSKWVDNLLKETGGDPVSFEMTFNSSADIAKVDRKKLGETARTVVAAREAMAFEMLDPNQRDKLRFVTLFVEVKRWGLREALMNGFVGEELKLSEGQYQLIGDKLDSLEKERQVAMKSIGKKIEGDLSAELSREQQELWKKAIGKEFQFSETEQEKRMQRVMSAMGRKTFIPNPDVIRECMILLQRNDVAEELELSDEQVSLFKKASRSMADPQWINKMLNDKQLLRVKQLAFRFEVFRIGIHKALNGGHLGTVMEITKSQADSILKSMPEHQRLVVSAEHESIKKCLRALSESLDKQQKSTLEQIVQVNCEGVE